MAAVDAVAGEAEVASTAAGTKAALALATGSVVSGAGDIAAGESPTGSSAAGATGKLPRELFRILGAAGRCGLWAHAARVSRVSARSDRGKRLMGGVAKFRTFRRRATFPAPGHGSSWCRTLLGQGPEFNR